MPQQPTPTAPAPPPPPLATLEAVLERITYANEETGYTVARVRRAGQRQRPAHRRGQPAGRAAGREPAPAGPVEEPPPVRPPVRGRSYTTVLPATLQGIRRYLGSGLIKGIGPKMAERIVAHFDTDTLRVIEEEPGRLVEVPGPGTQAHGHDQRAPGRSRRPSRR